ncbi:MAG: DUF4230 domain-containing protein [Flavobacteriaceae bacterium]|nr:DUF4230 domain-containing protein [Flavobacteriaceae bacterium]
MRKLLIVLILILLFFFGYQFFNDKSEKDRLFENTSLIQEQIAQVGKLIVTEGHFSQVYTFKNSKELFGSLISAEKKALVVVNAEVTVSYDLSKVKFELDREKKILHIKSIPQEEIKINPDFQYYDVSADYLNPFDADDYNTIRDKVNASLKKKIEASSIKSNAENRLISELAKFYILTNSLGWTLTYEGKTIESQQELETLKL